MRNAVEFAIQFPMCYCDPILDREREFQVSVGRDEFNRLAEEHGLIELGWTYQVSRRMTRVDGV